MMQHCGPRRRCCCCCRVLCGALRVVLDDPASRAGALGDAEDPGAFVAQLLLLGPSWGDDSDWDTDEMDEMERQQPRGPTPDQGLCQPCPSCAASASPRHRSPLRGFDGAPYVHQVAASLCTWHNTGRPSIASDDNDDAPMMPVLEGITPLTASRERLLAVPHEDLVALVASVNSAVDQDDDDTFDPPQAARALIVAFLCRLGGARGLLTLLGFGETIGSRVLAPLTRGQCLAAFNRRHSPREPLTVGARALSKHCRRSREGWWGGEPQGNDRAKNAIARAKLAALLASCTWRNVHGLPHGLATLEVRNAEGYGARWYIHDQSFRGFLEPPMRDGHENKWQH